MFEVLIKSGTSGHYDYDNCDLAVADIPSNNIPKVEDTLSIDGNHYLVRSVYRVYQNQNNEGFFREFIRVYVIKI